MESTAAIEALGNPAASMGGLTIIDGPPYKELMSELQAEGVPSKKPSSRMGAPVVPPPAAPLSLIQRRAL